MERLRSRGQRSRVGLGLAYVVSLGLVNLALFGRPVPPLDPSGAWFYSGLLPILLGISLVEPYFTRPADAVTHATVALIAVLGFPDSNGTMAAPETRPAMLAELHGAFNSADIRL